MKHIYEKEFLSEQVKLSSSIAEVARRLKLRDKGSNFKTIKKYIDLYGLDVSHFTGQRWNKGKHNTEEAALIPLELILQNNTNYKSHSLKLRLFESGLKERKCEVCGIKTWQNKPITLELHHINGDHYDNRLENLQILCPNCHSQTGNFRGKGSARKEVPKLMKPVKENKICPICNKEFVPQKYKNIFCSRECYNKSLLNITTSSIAKENIQEVIDKYNTITDLAKHFNVSRPTMRKYLDEYNLLYEFKSKYDYRAKPVLQYDVNMNFIKEWPSANDAIKTLGIADVDKCASLKCKSAGGYIWRYKTP